MTHGTSWRAGLRQAPRPVPYRAPCSHAFRVCARGPSLPAWTLHAALPPAPGPAALAGPPPGSGAPAVPGAAVEARNLRGVLPATPPVRSGRAHADPERGAAPAHA